MSVSGPSNNLLPTRETKTFELHEFNFHKEFYEKMSEGSANHEYVMKLLKEFKESWYLPGYYGSILKSQFKDTLEKGLKGKLCNTIDKTKRVIELSLYLESEFKRSERAHQKNASIETRAPSDAELKVSQKLYDESMVDLPEKDRWRLFIDACRVTMSKDPNEGMFDVKEPGYKDAMFAAFTWVRNNLGKRMNSRIYEKLHDICVDGVRNVNGTPFEKGFWPGASYPVGDPRLRGLVESSEDLNKIKSEWKREKLIFDETEKDNQEDRTHYLATFKPTDKPNDFKICSHYSGVDDLRVDAIFNRYYEEMENAKSTKAKLTAIARVCRALEVFHSFLDGNQRTNAFALLNKLLLENGFPPCILYNPGCFDGQYTLEELVYMIDWGMSDYFKLCQNLRPGKKDYIPTTLGKEGKFAWTLKDPELNPSLWEDLKYRKR